MYLKTRTWFLVSLICFLGAAYFWRLGNERAARESKPDRAATTNAVFPLLSASNKLVGSTAVAPSKDTNAPFPYRISNTTKKIDELVRSDSAILLRNALIDSASGQPLPIPAHLRSQGDPGSYIVQSHSAPTDAFREQLRAAGAEVVSYVPNNAYLVRASATVVAQLRAAPQIQSVTPWEPYFKLSPKLLALAVEQQPLPNGNPLSILAFPGDTQAIETQLAQLGATVMRREPSPFGTHLLLHAPADQLVSIAQLPAVQAIEPAYRRAVATDLARTRVRVSTNTITVNNHLGLTGAGVRVGVNDTGVDVAHLDLSPRIIPDATPTGIDVNGHGTHVAGIIASTGLNGPNGSQVPGSTNGASFRGMAPAAEIFAQPIDLISGPLKPDSELQETAATNGVFISNNSWGYAGAFDYTFASAAWDAAVRDSVPGQTGSQAITYVFSAGNAGFGDNSGAGGFEDTVGAPGTAKNVITVGATEQIRNITNEVVINDETNTPFATMTDSDDQIAWFSSRGNVGPGIEGEFGRFKPDVVAPGVFVVSTRANGWESNLNVFVSVGYLTDEVIPVGDTNVYFFFGGTDTIEARIRLIPNGRSPVPFPTNSIYVRRGAPPPPSDFLSMTNTLNFSPVLDDIYYVGIGNNFNQDVHCDIQVIVLSTNEPTPGDVQLTTLNEDLEDYYRYESGTSMAAPVVSGMLALIQQRLRDLQVTNPSPALMKALLINGARSIGQYNLEVTKFANLQGWGLANLTNSLPENSSADLTQWPVRFFDQETNGLVTGQSQTRIVTLASNMPALRISLVWTDPPGNPAVASKLVNDLDLIVTNLSTLNQPSGPVVFVGNVISGDFSSAQGTNFVTDVINNVENVYINNPGTNRYSVTVRARQVNVNAVTAHNPTGIAQDYALVISAGNPASAPAFTIDPAIPTAGFDNVPLVTVISNLTPVFDQRVGANPNITPSTNGIATQWRFFQFEAGGGTNTNVAVFTFLTPNLSRPRTIQEADIDLYVSTNSALTNLDVTAVGTAWTSKSRGGTEGIALTNQTVQRIYYIGVKSEDQQAASFGLFGFTGSTPFSEKDKDGNVIVNGLGLPVDIADGNSEQASGALVFAFCLEEIDIRNVIVTNIITHEAGGDLIGLLQHNGRQSVLNNHRGFEGTVTLVYDDSDSGQFVDSLSTDPPGTLRNFWGQQGLGPWQMVMVDDSLIGEGRIEQLTIVLQPRRETNGVFVTLPPIPAGRWFYTFVDVPADASLLGIDLLPDALVELYVRRNLIPDRINYDHTASFGAPNGGSLEITTADTPPLSAGTYFIGLFNPNSAPLTVQMRIRLERNLLGSLTNLYASTAPVPLLDDAVTTSLLNVTNSHDISDVRVGVRIRHERASDLALTLVSPGGTRVLLAENRGGNSTLGYGGDPVPPETNYIYTIFTDNTNLTLTPIKFAQAPFTNQVCSNVVVGTGAQVLFDGFELATCGPGKAAGTVQSGWAVDRGDIDITCNNNGFIGVPHSGVQAVDLNGFNPGTISRSFATTTGQVYVLSHVYCRNPNSLIPNFTAFTDLLIDGRVVRNLVYGSSNTASALNWATNVIAFTATSNMTEIKFVSRNTAIDPACGTPCAGMYLDSVRVNEANFTLGSCNYVFPEEPLTQLKGENAYGTWRLEIWDNRVGAPLGDLLSWQLEFDFVNTNPPPVRLTNNVCYTGIAVGTNPVYFQIQVPFTATIATNTLTSSNNTISMLMGADLDMLPRGSRPPDDYSPNTGVAFSLIIRTNSNPPLPQGQTYYLMVRNTDPTITNHFELCIAFDRVDTNDLSTVLPIASGQCITNVIAVTNLLQYYQFDVNSNAVELTFQLRNLSSTGNVDMVINQGLPLPNPNTFFAQSAQPGTTTDLIAITNYNFTLGGRWYIGIYNRSNAPVQYELCVSETVGIRYTDLNFCTNGAIIPVGGVQYFQHTVSPIALRTHFIVSNIFGGDVNMFISAFPPNPPPSDMNFLVAGTNPGTTGAEIAALSLASMPPLAPGETYYIAITNTGPAAASYDLCVIDFPGYTPITNASCIKSTLVHSNDAHYFVFNVASNSVRADFQTVALGDVDLYLRKFQHPGPFPDYDYPSETPGSGNENIVLTTNTVPFPLQPGDWYLVVVNREPGPVDYCIQATQTGAPDITQIVCTNTVTIPANSVQYYDYAVSSNALRVHIQATNLSGNIDMYVDDAMANPFPGPGANIDESVNLGTADENIVHSRALRLNPPVTYRIAIRNVDPVSVTYSLCVLETTNYIVLANNMCVSNSLLASHQLDGQYYVFDVAPNAIQVEVATFSAQDVSLYVRRVPIPGIVLGFDDLSANPGTGNEVVLINTNSPARLEPGLWYAAVEYSEPGIPAEYCIRVKQYTAPDLTASPCTNAIIPAGEVQYYQFAVASNAFSVEFATTTLAGNDINMYIQPYPPLSLPGEGNAIRASATPGTGNESITLSSSSSPQLQAPGTYFIAITNASQNPVSFRLCANQITNGVPLTNAVCVTNTLAAMNDAHYYQVTIFSNSVRADFMTLNANGNVDLYIRRVVPPAPGPTSYDYPGQNMGMTNEIIVVTTGSPVPLAPGAWYIAVVNRDPAPVTYCMKVTQYPVLDPFNILLRITNGVPTHVDLGWNAFEFQRFYLEWTPTLSTDPIPWQPFTDGSGNPMEFGPVGGMGTNFHHRDQPLIGPNRFYRLNILP